MVSSLSDLVNNLYELFHLIKGKLGHDDENVKYIELNISNASIFLYIQTLKMI